MTTGNALVDVKFYTGTTIFCESSHARTVTYVRKVLRLDYQPNFLENNMRDDFIN